MNNSFTIVKLKPRLLVSFLMLFLFSQVKAQFTAVIGAGSQSGTSSNGAAGDPGPMYRSTATSAFVFSRYHYLYTAAELATAGITAGSQITKLAWFKDNNAATNSTCTFEVWIKNSSLTTVGPGGQLWATLISGSTQVYNNTTHTVDTVIGWHEINFSAPFIYSGGALEISTNFDISNGTSPWTTAGFSWKKDPITDVTLSYCAGAAPGPTQPNLRTVRPQIQISYGSGLPCIAPPTPGTVNANINPVCPNVNFTLSISGGTNGSGQTYQWESSPNNTNWTTINGATLPSYQTSQTADTYYRCVITCSAQSAPTAGLLVSTNTFLNCYCTSGPTGAAGSDIGNVTFATLNNGTAGAATNNATSTNTYSNFTSLPATSLTQGAAYPVSITQINSAGFTVNYATVHIDFNHDGIFDPTDETFAIGASVAGTGGNILTGTIGIPFTTQLGQTRMRIVLRAGGSATQSPCGTYATGETEDYLVDILAGTACTVPPVAGTALTSLTGVCGGASATISLSGNSIGSGQTYQWQSSPDNINWSAVTGVTGSFFTITLSSTVYYRCIVTCSGNSDTSTVVTVNVNPPTLCYCVTSLGGGGCASYTIDDVIIVGTTLSNLSNGCTGTTANTLTVFPPTGNTTASLIQGIPYDLSVTLPVAAYVSVWIDYDRNGVFAASEWQQVCIPSTSSPGVPNVIQITVPFSSSLGQTGMRIRSRSSTPNGAPDACLTFGSGETEDYIITLIPNVACTGTPNPGIVVAPASICPNTNFSLTLSGSTLASGLSYQWESSTDNVNWTPITGANTISHQANILTPTYFRCCVTCSASSACSPSSYVLVKPFYNCYCNNSNATNTLNYDIGNVTFGALNNGIANPLTNNSSAVNAYSDFTNLSPVSLVQTLSYPFSTTQISSGTLAVCNMSAYIDYNHDGIFDVGSEEITGGQMNATISDFHDTITIPPTALTGITRMRVVMRNGTAIVNPCGTYLYGETEDYLVNILSPTSCTIPFIAGFAKANVVSVCASDPFTLSIDSLAPDTGYSYQWQHSFDNINWTNITGATSLFYSGTQSFDSWYRAIVFCNGGNSVNSAAVQVLNKPVSQCNYCNLTLNGNCSTNYFIDSLAIGGTPFNNANTGCAANAGFAYSKYPVSGNTTADLGRGNYYDLYLKTAGACNISVWLDYDQSGKFDANEWVQASQSTDSAVTVVVPLVVPSSAKLGVTGMRVRSRKAGNLNFGTDACSTYGSGETEDYYVTISDAISTGKELANDRNIRIYPNPSTGMVNIEYHPDEAGSLQVKLMTPGGQLIWEESNEKVQRVYSAKIDLTSYSKGIYFIQFISDKNVKTRKIVLN